MLNRHPFFNGENCNVSLKLMRVDFCKTNFLLRYLINKMLTFNRGL